jgi:hypothetical protein
MAPPLWNGSIAVSRKRQRVVRRWFEESLK